MSDSNIEDLKTEMSDSEKKKPLNRTLIPEAAAQEAFHITEDSSPNAPGPLHTPSFASSPSAADVASSEVS